MELLKQFNRRDRAVGGLQPHQATRSSKARRRPLLRRLLGALSFSSGRTGNQGAGARR